MCKSCSCECAIAFSKNSNERDTLRRETSIYDRLVAFPTWGTANFERYLIQRRQLCISHKMNIERHMRCVYDSDPDSVHSLYQRLMLAAELDNAESRAELETADSIWYVGQAFTKCRENVCFSPFKFTPVQHRIENLIKNYHAQFVKSHRYYIQGLTTIASHLFDENRQIVKKVQAPPVLSTPVKKECLRDITNEDRDEIKKIRRRLIF